MGHIFLSYSHKDTTYAHVLANHLRNIAYGLKTSTEETKNKYTDFSTIYEQKSKLTMLEIWHVILNGSM